MGVLVRTWLARLFMDEVCGRELVCECCVVTRRALLYEKIVKIAAVGVDAELLHRGPERRVQQA